MALLTNSPVQPLNFSLERRKSYSFKLALKYTDAAPVDLTGCTIRFVLKPDSYDDDQFDVTNLLVNSVAEIPEPLLGYGYFSFQAAELDQEPGEYSCSIVLWTPTGYSIVLTKGTLTLLENTESDSMHRQYPSATPGVALELTLRDSDVVTLYATNMTMAETFSG